MEIMKKLLFIPIIILVVVFLSSFKSASKDVLIMYGEMVSVNKKLSEVSLTIVDEDKNIMRLKSDKNGFIAFGLKYNKNYLLLFSKEGLESKVIRVNTFIKEGLTKTTEFAFTLDLKPGIEEVNGVQLAAYLEFTDDNKINCFVPENPVSYQKLEVMRE